MEQGGFEGRVGHAVKHAQAALNAAMEARLRPLGLGVSQYACLAQLDADPGLSNAGLARAVFVSRQATHQLLAGLTAAGLVEVDGVGRARRLRLSAHGAEVLGEAAERVAQVEEQMLAGLSSSARSALLVALHSCVDALEHPPSS